MHGMSLIGKKQREAMDFAGDAEMAERATTGIARIDRPV